MALELVDPENRPVPGILWHIVNATGNFVLLFFAYFIREWDNLMLAITLPCLGRFSNTCFRRVKLGFVGVLIQNIA